MNQLKIILFILFALFILDTGTVAMDYQTISLNGRWQLEPGQNMPEQWTFQVEVPALVDCAEPTLNWQEYDYFWYRKEFQLPQDADFNHLYLQIEQVQFGTEVWLNGQRIGGDIPCYTSQEFDLSPFANKTGTNVLLVRVGAKKTLPQHSAVGNDFEKLSWIPGIWGDVWLHLYGSGRVKWTQIVPDIDDGTILVHQEIENLTGQTREYKLICRVLEKNTKKVINHFTDSLLSVHPKSIEITKRQIEIPKFKHWSPENPFLYVLDVALWEQNDLVHQEKIPFGMREFEIRGKDFYLNGHRRVLMGSNIAFHRMFSDSTKGTLPWQKEWIKKVLVDIPQAHNMFFFRFHLGHAYNRWYDVADEHGILLQDEWMFWTTTGSAEQIEKEFRAWVRENCNHPSIVIWDALNESEDTTITEDIIPQLKKLDPTRPWEKVDFREDHPYIYSLGPVLNAEKFGYTRSIFDLKTSRTPTMVNEYVWWWLDREGNPTSLSKGIIERWIGRNYDKEDLLQHQAFLASELTELWRRLDIDAIQPFVYLSVGGGPTANWFFGPLNELRPKPILAALKNTFSPVGVSIELWDQHFRSGEKRPIDVYLFNDSLQDQTIILKLVMEGESTKPFYKKTLNISAGEHRVVTIEVPFPQKAGNYFLKAITTKRSDETIAVSKKPVFVFRENTIPQEAHRPALMVYDASGEIGTYLHSKGIPFKTPSDGLHDVQVIIAHSGIQNVVLSTDISILTRFVKDGGILILQEPEFGVEDEQQVAVLDDLELNIQYRRDPEKGGYDTYVFPEESSHFIWQGIRPEHLRFFNGGFGGEMVSQHNVRPNIPFKTLANCNLSLKVPAVMEIPYGNGWVIISRIQIRGRMNRDKLSGDLFDRRFDPIAERYFWNLITSYVGKEDYRKKVQQKLEKKKIYIARIKASTGQVYDAIDGKMTTRWSSKAEDPQWIWIDFGRPTSLEKLTIHWEVAYGKVYEIFHSNDNEKWHLIHQEPNSDGGTDHIRFQNLKTRYLRIDFKKRGTQWGYSIWEMEFE